MKPLIVLSVLSSFALCVHTRVSGSGNNVRASSKASVLSNYYATRAKNYTMLGQLPDPFVEPPDEKFTTTISNYRGPWIPISGAKDVMFDCLGNLVIDALSVGAHDIDDFSEFPFDCYWELEDEDMVSTIMMERVSGSKPVSWELVECMLYDMKSSTYYWIDAPEHFPSVDFRWKKDGIDVKGSWVHKDIVAGSLGTTRTNVTTLVQELT